MVVRIKPPHYYSSFQFISNEEAAVLNAQQQVVQSQVLSLFNAQ